MQQDRRGREGDRQAQADVAPAEEQLKQLPSEPAFWLAAPLGAAGAIDWALVDEAGRLFETCAWPRLSAQGAERRETCVVEEGAVDESGGERRWCSPSAEPLN